METTGSTVNQSVSIKWGYCDVNPITQAIEHFYKQRKKNG